MFGLRTEMRTNSGRRPHPAVAELAESLCNGRIGRRDFLQTASWLGISAASARAFAAAAGGGAILLPAVAGAQETPKRGGTLRFTCQIQQMSDPTAVSWIEASDLYRNCLEFLTFVDADNVVHPYLAESWDPSADLKTWSFRLRRGVKWSNGDDLTSEDVAFTIKRWLGPDSKSSNKSAFSPVSDVEVVSPTEFRLHLNKPLLAIPEMFYAYTTPILHRSFDATGGDWPKHPLGTGPYTMTDYAVGQQATFRRRDGYWGEAPYLDEIRYIDMGSDVSAHLAALAAGQVDILYRITTAELEPARAIPDVTVLTGHSAQTVCMRMQATQKPFDDIRVRRAVQLCADNAQMLELGFRGMGVLAEHHHVAPSHPEYYKLPALTRDVAQAKQLLKDAGHPDGIDLTLVVGNTQGSYEQNTAQVLQQNCAEAGIRIRLNVIPATEYWPVWDRVPFGLTFWAHRPLGVMTLDLAYRTGAAWNESKFANKDFDAGLDRAMGIVDPKQRSQEMRAVEEILQREAVMVQPFWPDKLTAISSRVQGFVLHPADYFDMRKVWLS